MKTVYKNLILVGDNWGLPCLLKYIPHEIVKYIVGSSIRPNQLDELKQLSNRINVPLLIQPKYNSHKYEQFSNNIINANPDLLICNSYSMIIRPEILKATNYNAINIHPALLPKNRGPHPTQWVLINGEQDTGVTIHYMEETLDTGDIIAQKKISIDLNDSWVTLENKLNMATDILVSEQILNILNHKIERTNQYLHFATTNHKLDAEFPEIDFKTMNDLEIFNLIRAQISPLGGAFIKLQNGDKIFFKNFIPYDMIKDLRIKYSKI